MLDLLSNYTVSEIIIFLVLFALAVKGVVSYGDWGMNRLRKIFNKETQREKEKREIEEHFTKQDEKIENLRESLQKNIETLDQILNKIDLLMDSDKDSIKSYITEKHHYFVYENKWIDDYSLDCLERRYKHYVNEGGNSFVLDLMEDLRDLPKQSPQS